MMLRLLWRDQCGASLPEYTILIALIMLAALAAIIYVGGWTSTTWTEFFSRVSP